MGATLTLEARKGSVKHPAGRNTFFEPPTVFQKDLECSAGKDLGEIIVDISDEDLESWKTVVNEATYCVCGTRLCQSQLPTTVLKSLA